MPDDASFLGADAGGDPRRPEIAYPARWPYQVIGADAGAMEAAIRTVVESAEHDVLPGRTSRGGNWCSLRVVVLVRDEDHRLALYHALRRHAAIRLVL